MADRTKGILLDSSVVIAYLRGRLDLFSLARSGEELYLPLVALGELYKGAEKSARSAHNRKLVDDFLERVSLLYPDVTTARVYAATAAALETIGQPINQNDIWIAAVALELDMPLATRDAHFDRVPGLSVLAW